MARRTRASCHAQATGGRSPANRLVVNSAECDVPERGMVLVADRARAHANVVGPPAARASRAKLACCGSFSIAAHNRLAADQEPPECPIEIALPACTRRLRRGAATFMPTRNCCSTFTAPQQALRRS